MSNRKRPLTYFGAALLGMLDAARVRHYRFYEAIGITRAYFYEILRELPPSPEVMENILDTLDEILPEDPERRTFLLDQAAKTKGEIPPDIYEAICANPEQWNKLRKYLKRHM